MSTSLAPVAPSVASIIQAVAATWGVTPREIGSMRRSNRIVVPRHVAMWLAREMTGHSYPTIARLFEDRDHTTVMYGVSRTEARMARDPAFARQVRALAASFGDPADD